MRLPIRTERLVLAPLGEGDVDAFVAYRREPEVARWQSWTADYPREHAERIVASNPTGTPPAGEWIQLAVHGTDSPALLGDVAVHTLADQPRSYELGVTLAPAAQRRGYAAEAVGAVRDELFGGDEAHRVIAQCDGDNRAVQRLLERIGLRREARFVDGDWFKGRWTTLEVWAQLRREWAGQP